MGCRPVGISSQSVQGLRRAAADTDAKHMLLSDPDLQLARALGLSTFNVDNTDWDCRLTLVITEGTVAQAFSPVGSARRSAAQVIAWMRGQGL
jgi:peroxiredoxin